MQTRSAEGCTSQNACVLIVVAMAVRIPKTSVVTVGKLAGNAGSGGAQLGAAPFFSGALAS